MDVVYVYVLLLLTYPNIQLFLSPSGSLTLCLQDLHVAVVFSMTVGALTCSRGLC